MAACAWSSEKMNRIFGRSAANRHRMCKMQINAVMTDKRRTRRIMNHPKVVKRFQQQQNHSLQVDDRFKQTCVRKKSFLDLASHSPTQPTIPNRIQSENNPHSSCCQLGQQKLRVDSHCGGFGFELRISNEELDNFFLQTMTFDPVRSFASVSRRTF